MGKEKPLLQAARNARRLPPIDPQDNDYNSIVADARARYELEEVPGMPVVSMPSSPSHEQKLRNWPKGLQYHDGNGSSLSHCAATEVGAAGHVDHIADKGPPTAEFMGLIHTPIAIRDAMKIEETAAAINKEWDELSKIAWDVNKVRSRQDVIKKGIKT